MSILPVGLVELTPKEKRRQSATIIGGGKTGFNHEEVLLRLRQVRQSSVNNLGSFCQAFQQNASQYHGVSTVFAADAAEAVAYIDKVLKEKQEIAVNKSATVNDLRAGLTEAGYTLVDTYLPQFTQHAGLENRLDYYWQLLALSDRSVWGSFQCTDRSALEAKDEGGHLKDLTALVGVNAAGARDGSLFLLQHSDNIGTMLRQAKRLILVLGIEKIVADREEALFQSRCAGFFGMESALLDLEIAAEGQNGVDILKHALEAKDAEREIHVILLDNGRCKLAGGPFQELLYCISCRACLKRCPTYRFFGKGIGRHPKDYLWSFLAGFNSSLDLCLHCQSCRDQCPLDIDIPLMIAKAKSGRFSRSHFLQGKILANAAPLAGTGKRIAPLANLVLKNKWGKLALDWAAGIDKRRELPELQETTLEDWFNSRGPAGARGKKVAYYAGCFASYFDTRVGKAAIQILERNDFEVTLVRNSCCGIAKIGSGDIKGAFKDAENLLRRLTPLAERGYDIVVSCPSCGLTLKKEYLSLIDSDDARLVSSQTYDLNEYLIKLHRRGELDTDFQPMPLLVAYHNPCHLKAQGVECEPVELMRLIPELSVELVDRGCCGMAGTFGFKTQHYQHSMEIGRPLFDRIDGIAPQVVATDCAACKMQLEGASGKEIVHPLVLLQRCYEEGRHPVPYLSGKRSLSRRWKS